jgi:glutamate racemase
LQAYDNRPIGVFDSGIGGLTVAHAINQRLPFEKIIYFGDTAHLPYGEKSKAAIREYSEKITSFLLEKDVKIIVIACNSASSAAFSRVKKLAKGQADVINVIDPVVQHVVKTNNGIKVGVIGTKATINSRVYVRKIQRKNPYIKVGSLATPLLAPMIEEGFFNNYISKTIIHSYLSKPSLQNINQLILGCTHYPLIEKEIKNFFQNKVSIINSANIVAQAVEEKLKSKNHLANRKKAPQHKFYVSDYTDSFKESAKFFFGKEIQLIKNNIWK